MVLYSAIFFWVLQISCIIISQKIIFAYLLATIVISYFADEYKSWNLWNLLPSKILCCTVLYLDRWKATQKLLSFINSHCLITQLTILRGNVHARTYLLVLLPVNSIYYFSITVTYPVICIIAITITARKEFNYYYYCNVPYRGYILQG